MEEAEQEEARKKRKASAKLKPVRPWTALIFWLVLNLIWISAVPMATEHPVMEPNSGFREWHNMEVPELLGHDLPLHIECSFQPQTAADESVRVVWSLREDSVEDPMEIRTWNGSLGDDCAASDHTVPGGVYVLHVELFYANDTKVDRSNVPEVSDIDLHMQYWIYQPVRKEGLHRRQPAGLHRPRVRPINPSHEEKAQVAQDGQPAVAQIATEGGVGATRRLDGRRGRSGC